MLFSRRDRQLKHFVMHRRRLENAPVMSNLGDANRVVRHIQSVMHSAAQKGLPGNMHAQLKAEANRVWTQRHIDLQRRSASPPPTLRPRRPNNGSNANRLVRNAVASVVQNQRRRQQEQTDLANLFSRLDRLSWR